MFSQIPPARVPLASIALAQGMDISRWWIREYPNLSILSARATRILCQNFDYIINYWCYGREQSILSQLSARISGAIGYIDNIYLYVSLKVLINIADSTRALREIDREYPYNRSYPMKISLYPRLTLRYFLGVPRISPRHSHQQHHALAPTW